MVTVGQVGGPYGVRGWVRIRSFTAPPDGLLKYQPWYLRPKRQNGDWSEYDLAQIKPHGGGFIGCFSTIADRNAALPLAGAAIGVTASSLPPLDEDEFYWRDLIGLRVVNEDDMELGVVAGLMPTGTHDVMVVKNGSAELLIPFAHAYSMGVFPERGLIQVRWQGMD